ncbi:hypothetical protein [Streptobacillus canis]|uniref:hypothetical protein n=1 Tax=Streptobacillus canis TaxID=2678686 RepID=UPI0012E2D989|nr:hypothetical protein [Streptobacillus canis]
MEKVLEIEIKKINQEYSVWWITYQNEWVFPRGEFKDDELGVYSFMQPTIFEDEKEGWILNIKGKAIHYDITPKILENKYLPILIKKVDEINEKYGIKTENSMVDRDKLNSNVLRLQRVFNVFSFNLNSFTDKETKEKLSGIKDELEYILEAFEKAKKI